LQAVAEGRFYQLHQEGYGINTARSAEPKLEYFESVEEPGLSPGRRTTNADNRTTNGEMIKPGFWRRFRPSGVAIAFAEALASAASSFSPHVLINVAASANAQFYSLSFRK
jgi:hypothetical protein